MRDKMVFKENSEICWNFPGNGCLYIKKAKEKECSSRNDQVAMSIWTANA